MISAEAIEAARSAIAPIFKNSPILNGTSLDPILDAQLVLKVETINPVRSFKGRGCDFFVRNLSDSPHLVCASAGNFGQGLAYAARATDRALTVFVAKGANRQKLAAMEDLGADIVVAGHDLDAAKSAARSYAGEQDVLFVEDGAVEDIAIGAGTIAAELLEQVDRMEAIVIPVGNGALAHGVSSYFRQRSPKTRIICVMAAGAPAMARSIERRSVVACLSADTIADGIAVREPVPLATDALIALEPEVVTVSEGAIKRAIGVLARHTGLIVEPAGAVGVAAIMEHHDLVKGLNVATILCGSNVEPALFASVIHDGTF